MIAPYIVPESVAQRRIRGKEVCVLKGTSLAGAVGIIAVSRLFGHLRFPYMFGGDGVTMLLPPQWSDRALKALSDVAVFVERSYGLQLRIGKVDVSTAVNAAGPITVAKTRVSERYTQASFDGPGVDYAESLLKSDMLPAPPPGDGETADTSGFSCRWNEVPSQRGEIMALVHIVITLRLPIRLPNGKVLSNVPTHNIVNADFQKYDGRLKTIVACSPDARAALIAEIDNTEADGDIRYGLHLSDRSVMTCLIHAKAPDEVHFIDAADGGYARAADMLKKKSSESPSGHTPVAPSS